MSKRRTLLPALRRALSAETKAMSMVGDFSMSMPRSTSFGLRDASAGWDMETVVTDGYERVVWVFKAVEIIAGNASRLPFKITDADGAEVENHPLLRVMNKSANPLETGRQFRKRLSQQILLSKKGAFVEVTKNRRGQVTRLDLLPPDRVQIIPDPGGDYVLRYEFTRYDGEVREIAPERIRWIREPHPLDPFSGVTPLEAAGMSVELDRLARQYNVSFIQRDGRPGGILGVDTDGLDDDELDRITNRLKPGPLHAGEIAAIGTGPGGIDYVDTSSKPRDMAYETTSDKAKKEILGAFGVPESLAGNASERTYENASQEQLNFWQDPMLPHLDLIAAAFDGDIDEDLDNGFDTSEVEALELPARRRRQEAREEFDKGLRSVDEYRPLTDDLEPLDNPQSRALWLSPAKAPVPGLPEDAEALGLGDPNAVAGEPPQGGDPAALPQTATEVVAQALAEGAQTGGVDELSAAAEEGPAAQALSQARLEFGTDDPAEGDAAAAVHAARMEGKALMIEGRAVRIVDPEPETEPLGDYSPGEDEQRRVELAVSAALDALLARQAGVIAARLESPKMRRGTRYWEADGDTDTRTGDEPINAEKVVDAPRWVAEMQETLQPIAGPAAQESANGLLSALVAAGVLTAAGAAVAPIVGRVATSPAPSPEAVAKAAAQAGVASAMLALAIASSAMHDWLDDRVSDLDRLMTQEQLGLPDLVAETKKVWEHKGRTFAESLAITVSQTVVAGGREAAAETVIPKASAQRDGYGALATPSYIERMWRTREDERVRDSHEQANGQVRMVGEMFDVGGYDLRFPCDPLGAPSVTRWCRCWLRYQWAADARFELPD